MAMTKDEILFALNVAANGNHAEMAKVVRAIVNGESTGTVAAGTQADHITDIATDASGTEISVAVNAILVVLETYGMTETS